MPGPRGGNEHPVLESHVFGCSGQGEEQQEKWRGESDLVGPGRPTEGDWILLSAGC